MKLAALPAVLLALSCSSDPPGATPSPATECVPPAQLLAHIECSFSPTADIAVRFQRDAYSCARVTDQAEVNVGGELAAAASVLCPGDACPPIDVKGFTISLGAELKVIRAAPAGSWTSPIATSCR